VEVVRQVNGPEEVAGGSRFVHPAQYVVGDQSGPCRRSIAGEHFTGTSFCSSTVASIQITLAGPRKTQHGPVSKPRGREATRSPNDLWRIDGWVQLGHVDGQKIALNLHFRAAELIDCRAPPIKSTLSGFDDRMQTECSRLVVEQSRFLEPGQRSVEPSHGKIEFADLCFSGGEINLRHELHPDVSFDPGGLDHPMPTLECRLDPAHGELGLGEVQFRMQGKVVETEFTRCLGDLLVFSRRMEKAAGESGGVGQVGPGEKVPEAPRSHLTDGSPPEFLGAVDVVRGILRAGQVGQGHGAALGIPALNEAGFQSTRQSSRPIEPELFPVAIDQQQAGSIGKIEASAFRHPASGLNEVFLRSGRLSGQMVNNAGRPFEIGAEQGAVDFFR